MQANSIYEDSKPVVFYAELLLIVLLLVAWAEPVTGLRNRGTPKDLNNSKLIAYESK